MFSLVGSAVSAARNVGKRLLGPLGSNAFTGYRWPSTTESSNTREEVVEFAEDHLAPGDHLLSITLMKMGDKELSEVFSVSFVTSESLAPAVLKSLSELPATLLTRLPRSLWDAKS